MGELGAELTADILAWLGELPDLPQAACRASPHPDIFHQRTNAAARELCAGCPEQAACLAWATAHHEQGIWGGQSERQRRALRRAG